MAYGTLPNIANAGHEPTPNERAEQIAHNLFKLPRSHFTVIDGTCGEGNLLAPFQGNAHAELMVSRSTANGPISPRSGCPRRRSSPLRSSTSALLRTASAWRS